MTWYEFLPFVHSSASVIWVGASRAWPFALGLGWTISRAQAVATPGEAPA